jgi:enolase-phosphatase E1
MIPFAGRLILLDIEGTTSNLAFVHEVLFPYARQRVAAYLTDHRGSAAVHVALEQLAHDAGTAEFAAWCPHPAASAEAVAWVAAHVHRLMDADAKQTGLKQLQGLIWEDGYRDGTLRAHVFPEVPACLRAWRAAGLALRIYSSGSVAAQKLFFAHTVAGDLTPLFAGYHDTKVGGKREPASYRAIAAEAGLPPRDILFLSDVPEELDAAQAAGCAVALAERPGNRPVEDRRHPRFRSFEEIQVAPVR